MCHVSKTILIPSGERSQFANLKMVIYSGCAMWARQSWYPLVNVHSLRTWKWWFIVDVPCEQDNLDTLWWTFTVCELESGPVEIVDDYPLKIRWIFPWQNVSSPEGKPMHPPVWNLFVSGLEEKIGEGLATSNCTRDRVLVVMGCWGDAIYPYISHDIHIIHHYTEL